MQSKLLAGIALASLAFAGPAQDDAKPSPLPKDTLPATLSIDHLPLGLDQRSVPKDNALTQFRVALGRKLFFDPILSGDQTVACVSCHRPENGLPPSRRARQTRLPRDRHAV